MKYFGILLLLVGRTATHASTIIVDKATRDGYISTAKSLLTTKDIGEKDMFNGPPNPYKLETFQTLNCTFVEPSVEDQIGKSRNLIILFGIACFNY